MKLITKTLPDNHNIFFFGDQHKGSVLSSQHGWKTLIKMMNSKYEGCVNNYGIDMGDMIEAITVDDKRFTDEKLKEPLPGDQRDAAIEDRQEIKEKLLCILMGNHERKLWRFENITQKVCEKLGVEYGTYTAKLTIQDGSENLMYKIYVAHGFKGIRSTADDPIRKEANEELQLKRHLKFKAGDCAVMCKGHTHKLKVCKPQPTLYLVDDTKRIQQQYTSWGQAERYIHPDLRWYGNTGSFLKLYGKGISGYAETMEYDPVELGFLVLIVRKKKIIELRPIYLKI